MDDEQRKKSTDSGTGRFSLADDFFPFEWYGERLDFSSPEEVSLAERHRLSFELWLTYKRLVLASYGNKTSSFWGILWVHVLARLRLTQFILHINAQ